MLNDFLEHGSHVGVVLCFYAACVYFGFLQRLQQPPNIALDPPVLQNTIGSIFQLAALPANLWIAVYLAQFLGLFWGVLAGMALFALSAILGVALKLGGKLIGLHVILGLLALVIGYFLTIASLFD
ncbi:hypothetical protein FTO60_04290 [Octadecabacter sp. SW4]|uniref:hypothetical protein n=1 Tax=Octadecabacter sp. SW4 TaxID=2602067 RepID=UPI0011C1D706|nr:hypothetical protein [Octadecabacter sp. SW4]QEE34999.1 hypothetical protein FTO60_04290 [Octadecabacter sp. SW4]